MKTKGKVLRIIIALAVLVTMLLGALPVMPVTTFAANVSYVKEAGKDTLLTRENLAKLGNGQLYKTGNGYQMADFQGRQWLMAGSTNSDFTGGKDGLVLWSPNDIATDKFAPSGSFLKGFHWRDSRLYKQLNSDDKQYWTYYNINQIFTPAAKSKVLPVTVEDWTRQKSYNNYLYIPDRNDAGNGFCLGPQVNELLFSFNDYIKTSFKRVPFWLRSVVGIGGDIYYITEDVSNDCMYYDKSSFISELKLLISPAFVMDTSKTLLASTMGPAAKITEGKHVVIPGLMHFRFVSDEKIKSTIEYSDDSLCIRKDNSDEDLYLCVQYATWGTSEEEAVYTKKINGDEIIDPFDIGINTYRFCKIWLEKYDSADNLIYAKEAEYYKDPTIIYTSYGETEAFTAGVGSSKTLGKVAIGGFAPSYNPEVSVQVLDENYDPAEEKTTLRATVENGELIASTLDITGPGTYYLQIKATDGENTKYSTKIPVSIGRCDHAQNEQSLSVAAGTEGRYTTTIFWPAEGGKYGTPEATGDIKATDISIDTTGSDKKISFTVPSCEDGSTGKIIIPVTGCKLYNDYNIVINITAYYKSVTYWSKGDLEYFGNGKTYYVKSGVLQKASFAGKTWYAIGVEKLTENKKGLVLLSASAISQRVYNPGGEGGTFAADYASSELNKALNSKEASFPSEECNVNKMFTEDERACILPVNVDYSWDTEKRTADNALLYVPDGNAATLWDGILLGSKNTFSIKIEEWNETDSEKKQEGLMWCRSRTEYGKVCVAGLRPGYQFLGTLLTDEADGKVVPQLDLDISKVLFASAAPAANADGTSTVTPNETMVFRFDGSSYIKSSFTAEAGNLIYNIEKDDRDTQPLYLCAQYDAAEGTKIYTTRITKSGSVDLSSVIPWNSDVTVWLETTSETGGMVYAKKVQPVLSFTPADPLPTVFANTENAVTIGTARVKGYSEADIILTATVCASEEKGGAVISDGSISAYFEDGKLLLHTNTQLEPGTYSVKLYASSQFFTEALTTTVTVSVVKRTYSPAALSMSVSEGTNYYTISNYYPYGGGVLQTPSTEGGMNISDITVTKKYSSYGISFKVTDAKAGQTGMIKIPVSGGTNTDDYCLTIAVICAGSAPTWYSQETLKSLGSNGVCYKGGDSILKANFAGKTWLVAGAENNVNTGNKDTLVMVSTGTIINAAAFDEKAETTNYGNSTLYKLLNSENSAYVNREGNAHKLFGSALKYVVPVSVNSKIENGNMAVSTGNYLYIPDGDTNIGSINMGTTGSYSVSLGSFLNNVTVDNGFTWLRTASKTSYLKAIVNFWGIKLGEKFMMAEDGHVIPEFNLDLQNVLFASPASAAGEGTVTVDPNSSLVFRFRDSGCFDGRVNYNGEGSAVSVVLNKTYAYPVYLCVQYDENGTEKLYSVPVTSSGTIDLADKVKGNLSTAHIWLEMQDTNNGVVYATLSEISDHKHSMVFGVSEDGKSLEAWCGTGAGSNCEYSKGNKISLTLDAQNTTYTSATYEASLKGIEAWTKAGLEIPAIYYEGVEGTSYVKTEQPPYDAGTYQATVSAGEVTASVQFAISKRALTVTGTTVENKTYDGTTVATVNAGSANGIIDGDDVKVAAAGNFNDVNAGDNKTVTVEYALSGEDAVNYFVPPAKTFIANIVKKDIWVSANSDASAIGQELKELTYTAETLVSGDVFTGQLATDPAERRNDTANKYTIKIGALSAGDNYTIHFTEGTYTVTGKKIKKIVFEDLKPLETTNESEEKKAEMEETKALETEEPKKAEVEETKALETEEPKLLAPILTTAETQAPPIEDGKIIITYGDYETFIHAITEASTQGTSLSVTYSSSAEDVAAVNSSTGEVTIKSAGTTVIKALAVDSTKEYEDSEASYILTVLKKPVAVPVTGTGLIYDGSEKTGVALDVTEAALYTEAAGSENTATNAGEYTCVLSLKNNNYVWNTPAPTSEDRNILWTIGRQRLSVKGSSADKEYDGSSLTTVKVGEVSGIIEKAGVKDDVQVTAEGEFKHPNVDDNREARVDYSLTGKDKDNYLAPFSEMINAKITPKKLTIAGTKIADKIYDGTRSAVATCGPLEGLLEGDDVLPLGWASFSDKNAGGDKEVVVVYTLMGEEAGNYEAPDMETLTAKITKATINVEAMNRRSYVGNDIEPLGYTYDNLFDGDSFTGELETNANPEKAGKYSITQGALSAGDNYNINFTNGTYLVEKKLAQDIRFKDIENNKLSKTVGDPDYANAVYGACSDVVLKSSNENVAVIDGMKVKIVGPGTAVITAVAEENDIYGSAEAKYTLTVKPAVNPGTGDSNNVLPYIIMMAAALLVIGLVILRGKKLSE